jgi:hypothetical protein
MNAERIRREVAQRRQRSERRLRLYEVANQAFFGALTGGDQVRAMDGTGRPIDRLTQYRTWLDGREGAPNYIPPIVEDYTALRGTVPAMKVRPRAETDADRAMAEDWTRVLREQWEHSNMDQQQEEAAFYWSLLGECLYLLEPVFPEEARERDIAPGIYLSVYPPDDVFPVMRHGWDRFELESVAVTAEMSAEQVLDRWPHARCGGSERRVEIVYWYDDQFKVIVAGNEEVDRWEHGLGFVPGVWSRVRQRGGMSNQSDVVNIIGLNRELQSAFLVGLDSVVLATYGTYVAVNPQALPEQIAVGPGAVVGVHEGGDLRLVQQSATIVPVQQLVDGAVQHMEHVSGASQIRVESGITGSNISGKAIRSSQGGQEQRLGISQQNMGRTFQLVNQKILKMLWKLPQFHADIEVWGEEKGTVYSFSFNGKDLEGWSRTTVEWDAAIGTTTHERAVMGLQLHAAGVVPRTYVGAQAGVDDPELMVRLADADKLAMARAEAQAQMAAQGGGQGGGPPGQPPDPGQAQQQAQGPAQQALSMEGGGMPPGQNPGTGDQGPTPPGGQGPPQPPAFPGFPDLPVGGPRGTPLPVPDFDKEVQRLLSQVSNQLQGSVISVTPKPGGVKVVLTNSKDFPLVRKALAPLGKVSVSVTGVTTGSNGRTR